MARHGYSEVPFEVILEKATSRILDCPGDFSSLKQMSDSNPFRNLNHLKKKSIFVRFK
jgi:hypothetical protein